MPDTVRWTESRHNHEVRAERTSMVTDVPPQLECRDETIRLTGEKMSVEVIEQMHTDTIVVIDDEPELLALLCDILEGEGYRVVRVDHPTLIAATIADHEPSLFLIDIMLPGISGITVAEQLRFGDHRAVPLVAMSASDAMVHRAARSGWFADVLKKPFDIEGLLTCVAGHLAA